jgi:hypothetical protein
MTVAELIEQLKQLPPESMVVRSGYEGGLTEVATVDIRTIRLDVNTEWWYGPHEEDKFGDVKAVFIG